MFNVEKLENNSAKITVTVANEQFKSCLDKAFEVEKEKVELPGFRKGSITRKMFESKFGVEKLYVEAINIAINETYPTAAMESKLEIISNPEIDLDFASVSADSDLVYTAIVWLVPVVTLGEYKGLEVEKESTKVLKDELEEAIKSQLASKTMLVSKEGTTLEKEDTAIMDYEGFLEDVPFDGGKAENAELKIGSGQFIPGFEDSMIGMNVGETKDIFVTFPTEYHSEELAGKDVKFVVTLHEIKVSLTPELTDELAKELNPEVSNVEDYKKDLKKKMEESKKINAQNKLHDELIRIASENATIDLPEVMINDQVEYIVKNAEQQSSQYGIDLATYLSMFGSTLEKFKEEQRPNAIRSLRENLTINKIAEVEELKISDKLYEEEFEKIAKANNVEVDKVKEQISKDRLTDHLIAIEVFKFLEKNSK